MVEPKNVLLVTNATTDGEVLLIKEAFAHAEEQNLIIQLNLVHVIPNLPTCFFSIPSMAPLAESHYEEATQTLASIGETLNVPKENQWLISGKIKTEVPRLANKLYTHFILASTTSIKDLHQSFLFLKKASNTTPVRSIGSLVKI